MIRREKKQKQTVQQNSIKYNRKNPKNDRTKHFQSYCLLKTNHHAKGHNI